MLILTLVTTLVAVPVMSVMGSVDAFGRSRAAWALAGFERRYWLWQAVGAVVLPVGLAYSGFYFLRVRPRLLAAERDCAADPVFAGGDGSTIAAGDQVRIRAPLWVAMVARAPVIVLVGASAYLTTDSTRRMHPSVALLWIPYALLVAAIATLIGRLGVTLTPSDAVIHGLWRTRVRWAEIAAVTQERSFGSRYVRIWTHYGYSRRLRAPYVPFFGVGRRQFEESFHLIGRWWLDHRGPGWEGG